MAGFSGADRHLRVCSGCIISMQAIGRRLGDNRIDNGNPAVLGRLYPGGVKYDRRSADIGVDDWSNRIGDPDTHSAIVLDHGIDNVHGGSKCLVERDIDAVLSEAENEAVFDVEVLAGKEADTVEARSNSVEPEVAQDDHIGLGIGLDNDSVGAADQY